MLEFGFYCKMLYYKYKFYNNINNIKKYLITFNS